VNGLLRTAVVAMALGATALPARGAQRAYAAVKDAFGHIRADYVDSVDDTNILRAAIKGMLESPAYDLHEWDNSGGLLDTAIAVTRLFLEAGLIATTTARGRETERFEAEAEDLAKGKSIVVLINERTAAVRRSSLASRASRSRATASFSTSRLRSPRRSAGGRETGAGPAVAVCDGFCKAGQADVTGVILAASS
jgi:Peptidase family S41